jgi:hypothetical protein
VNKDAPIPVYQVDRNGNSYLLGGVGLDENDRYSMKRHDMTVVENLRVGEPPGTHTFIIERNGDHLRVPVQQGRITPVEINYTLLDQGDSYRTYRTGYRVFQPVPFQEERLGARRTEHK